MDYNKHLFPKRQLYSRDAYTFHGMVLPFSAEALAALKKREKGARIITVPRQSSYSGQSLNTYTNGTSFIPADFDDALSCVSPLLQPSRSPLPAATTQPAEELWNVLRKCRLAVRGQRNIDRNGDVVLSKFIRFPYIHRDGAVHLLPFVDSSEQDKSTFSNRSSSAF